MFFYLRLFFRGKGQVVRGKRIVLHVFHIYNNKVKPLQIYTKVLIIKLFLRKKAKKKCIVHGS